MGVSDLNKIVSQFPIVDEFVDYNYILIDCSNLIVTYLFRHFAKLKSSQIINLDNYTVESEKSYPFILMSVEEQIKRLGEKIINDVDLLINIFINAFPSLEKIYIVSDPPVEYEYQFIDNEEIKMNCIDKEMFETWIEKNEFKDRNLINFSSKNDERKLRVQQQQSTHPINIYENEKLIKIVEDYEEFISNKDEKFKTLFQILYHLTYFQKRDRLMNLIPFVQHLILELSKNNKYNNVVEYYCSSTEADIFMKAFYDKYLYKEDNKTLIVSNDTDYDILFGEFPNVDVITISNFNLANIRNPYSYWYEQFHVKDTLMFRLILARVSALFGNDYTCHARKIVADAKYIEYLPKLFNLNNSTFIDIELLRTSALGKLVYNMKKNKDKINTNEMEKQLKLYKETNNENYIKLYKKYILLKHFKILDSTICSLITDKKSLKYFNGYYETLLIYINFKIYDKFIDLKTTDIKYDLPKILYDIKFDDGKVDIV